MTKTKVAAPIVTDRGEFALELEGARYGLRPSYEALDAIEEETGQGLMELTQQALRGGLNRMQLAIIACACIRAWGRANGNSNAAGASVENIGRMMMTAPGGLADTMATVGALLSLAVTGGITTEGEVLAAVDRMATASPPAAA